ncbi:class I SAM-dependent methyltransferase [Streptomyces sp. NPDC089799]|uniref:class I SAM-dependent methyltransferase n=1 Tax=Streptomyces sp. NPDC089799 TaxID=3155066 RepID=UPI00341D9B4B
MTPSFRSPGLAGRGRLPFRPHGPARPPLPSVPSVPSVPWLPLAVIAALAAGTVRSRLRLRALPVLPGPGTGGEPGLPAGTARGAAPAAPRPAGWRLITADGVEPDPGTFLAACAHAEREGLQVLDLVPGDLDAEGALGLLRLVDPAAYRRDRLAEGRSAGCAVLVAEDLLLRAGADGSGGGPDDSGPGGGGGPSGRPDGAGLHALVRRLKEFAPDATGIAVAPRLGRGDLRSVDRAAELRAQNLPVGLLTTARLAGLGLLAVLCVRRRHRRWGAAAAALYWLQPYAVLGRPGSLGAPGVPGSPGAKGAQGAQGGALRPAGLLGATAARPLLSLRGALRTAYDAATTPDRHHPIASAAEEAAYRADIAAGTERFLESRRCDCPWCGSGQLTVRVHEVPDQLQGKPGRFRLDRCADCGHVFQNPRLTPEGLDFYYRDFYAGRGGADADTVFGGMGTTYRERAEMIRPYVPAAGPAGWLDVGTGHGHFCNAARSVWPETRFDGLDMGDGVRGAELRGWVGTGFQGQFPEFAVKLAGQYEVVSMYHYLEHTRDPLAELDAAAAVLVPGGHLMVEVPDPESRMADLLRQLWLPWFQPQHQHLVPAGNLREALADRGFTVLAEEHGAAHQANEFVGAVALAVTRLVPETGTPWAAPAGLRRRAAGRLVRVAAAPCFAVAAVLDRLRGAAARRTDGGNAYRVLARKDEG